LFDGSSLGINAKGMCIAQGPFCQTALVEVDTASKVALEANPQDESAALFSALVMGVRDYFSKTKHKKAYIGLSGGIDSAVTACIAKEALGAENVVGVAMPSRFSSAESLRDAKQLAEALGIACLLLPIEEPFHVFCEALQPIVGHLSYAV